VNTEDAVNDVTPGTSCRFAASDETTSRTTAVVETCRVWDVRLDEVNDRNWHPTNTGLDTPWHSMKND